MNLFGSIGCFSKHEIVERMLDLDANPVLVATNTRTGRQRILERATALAGQDPEQARVAVLRGGAAVRGPLHLDD